MPTDNFKRIDLDFLYPEFRSALFDVIAACNERGCTYIATAGFRSYGEQTALWAQGRTRPGPKVTNALGGESAHNFGLAVDFVRDTDSKPGVQPSWKPEDYAVLIEEAEKRGLHSGKNYKDWPHVGVSGFVTAKDLQPLRLVWSTSIGDNLTKLKKVWEALETKGR
jgi:peptidoglycan L-alanyl-D-glutamate endopeptidase CwlK